VTRSLKPLRRAAKPDLDFVAPKTAAKSAKNPMPAPSAPPRSGEARKAGPPPPPPLAPLGRRLKQQLGRGTHAIDDRMDLHGMTQARAHDALVGFLRRAQAADARIVLVITGKGASGRDPFGERGVLRRQVPLWLRLSPFRELVVGFEQAHIGHGGEGALYVRVRRKH
jgi:DNA-nicking Smr family endonuclease